MTEFFLDKTRTESAPSLKEAACHLCELWHPAGGMHVLTRREITVLDAMRRVKEEARTLMKQGGRWQSGQEGMGAHPEGRLARLRDRWRKLTAERDAAREERMRLLGHESFPP